ncbi:uncharacterized protein UV8b_07514 [Ustilaginoidea virens]|uniref:Thiol methyltransferase n=1 Tax=Ustilaginoidea virens TaxID=1159556 RepID=A0A8E5HXT5_USTVR|nr:uncharacterized protein UV8b_07514 [Ustilaginoidea virens]QUC23273.1 hypothetical protein UV8b_07514 [Ustilaginoidea virens]
MAARVDEPSPLARAFDGVDFSSLGAVWSSLYKQGVHPWDRNGPSAALSDLLSQRADLVPPAQQHDQRGNLIRDPAGAAIRRTALVPGCGPGHDVLLLSSFGYDVVGLDFSRDAIRMAEENHKAADGKAMYEPVNGLERGAIRWTTGDFFSGEWATGLGTNASGKFDLIFDYTFLCALPPEARPRWAKRMSQLLAPDGHLICLEYPSGKPLSQRGPPWGLTPEVYEALLSAPGEDVAYDAAGNVVETMAAQPDPRALHRLSIIKPARTHKAGTDEDGAVRDFISVWTS